MAFRPNPPLVTEETVTVIVNDVQTEVEVTCEFDYSRASRGSREHGIQMEPDEPESAELISAVDASGKDWITELDQDELERLEENAVEEVHQQQDEPAYDPPDDPDYIGPY